MNSNRHSQDTQALLLRQRVNGSLGHFELSKFVAEHAGFVSGSRILDVGAGTGQLLLPWVRELDDANYHALDRSASSLAYLEREALALGLTITTSCADMDALLDPEHAPSLHDLSHVVAVYALYYSVQPLLLLQALSERLSGDGCIVVVGPRPDNNPEWFELLREAGVPLSSALLAISESFFPEIVEPFAGVRFEHTLVKDADNHVVLGTEAELMAYWRSNTYFDQDHDRAVSAAISKAFRENDRFLITKRIRLVRMWGRRPA
jgi:SAM-dependent methyltransferase